MKETFESAGAELDNILETLSSTDISLNEAVELYAKAAKLINFCTQELEQAQIKIEEINLSILTSEDKFEKSSL